MAIPADWGKREANAKNAAWAANNPDLVNMANGAGQGGDVDIMTMIQALQRMGAGQQGGGMYGNINQLYEQMNRGPDSPFGLMNNAMGGVMGAFGQTNALNSQNINNLNSQLNQQAATQAQLEAQRMKWDALKPLLEALGGSFGGEGGGFKGRSKLSTLGGFEAKTPDGNVYSSAKLPASNAPDGGKLKKRKALPPMVIKDGYATPASPFAGKW